MSVGTLRLGVMEVTEAGNDPDGPYLLRTETSDRRVIALAAHWMGRGSVGGEPFELSPEQPVGRLAVDIGIILDGHHDSDDGVQIMTVMATDDQKLAVLIKSLIGQAQENG